MVRIGCTFFAFLMSFPLWGQIGAKAQQGKISGTWHNNQFGYQMTLSLNSDGSGEFDGGSIRYSTSSNRLSIVMEGTKTDYVYNLQGNSLTLTGGDLEGQVTFTRGEGVSTPAEAPTYSKTSTDLMGVWSGNGEMIEFRPDGTCIYLGNALGYQASQGHLILTSAQGNATFDYTVKGRILTLSANGQKVVYNKAMGTGNQGTSGGQAYAAQAKAVDSKIPLELVGQWCYLNMTAHSQTSRCITLNADGTYAYSAEGSRSVNTNELSGGTSSQNGDRGTWYVNGDRIYYDSPTQGHGSYRLEKRNHPKNVNDPMIVLDGEAYVTMTNRPPWR